MRIRSRKSCHISATHGRASTRAPRRGESWKAFRSASIFVHSGGHVAGPTVILVHGTPTLNTVYWTEDRPASFCTKMAEVAGAKEGDVVAFGHTHLPFHRVVEGIHFVNTGSVGRPKDGDWRAGYAVLDVDGPDVRVDFIRVEYDLRRAQQAIRSSALPAFFADYLEAGGSP